MFWFLNILLKTSKMNASTQQIYHSEKRAFMQIRIITDDFTSALDGTGCFAGLGWDTTVLLAPDEHAAASVVSLDTDTREAMRDSGRQLIADAALQWRDADTLVLQFDSTLRGHVAHDCLTVMVASGRRKLLIAPAFPSAGRTTVNGSVLLDGVPVHQTAFAADPSLPVLQSHIPALFSEWNTEVQIARDAAHARELLEHCDVVVVDARTEVELDQIAADFASMPQLVLAGSTGLLRALARTLPLPDNTPASPPAGLHCGLAGLPPVSQPCLVVGSMNPAARRQLARVRGQQRIRVLATEDDRLASEKLRRQSMQQLVQRAAQLMQQQLADGLVVTGGETARRIVDQLPDVSLRVLAEVMPGVPLAEVRSSACVFPMITKAGGFGDDQALSDCVRLLCGTAMETNHAR